MFHKFLELITHYTELNEQEINYLQEHLPIKTYQKNDIIFSEGKISRTIYFVLDGCVRLYYNVEGKDKTAFFYTEGKFICAGVSYTFGVPAVENYQALENTTLIHFDKEVIEKLLQLSPKFEVMARIATEDELITYQLMVASFITKTPEERYIDLVETHGTLFNRVPQQYIASFLGISPETLSRIKKRVHQKAKT